MRVADALDWRLMTHCSSAWSGYSSGKDWVLFSLQFVSQMWTLTSAQAHQKHEISLSVIIPLQFYCCTVTPLQMVVFLWFTQLGSHQHIWESSPEFCGVFYIFSFSHLFQTTAVANIRQHPTSSDNCAQHICDHLLHNTSANIQPVGMAHNLLY